MGRRKSATLRATAEQHGWLARERPLPDDAALAEVLLAAARKEPAGPASSVAPYREQVPSWHDAGVQ